MKKREDWLYVSLETNNQHYIYKDNNRIKYYYLSNQWYEKQRT